MLIRYLVSTIAILMLMAYSIGCVAEEPPPVLHGGPVNDYVSLMDNLRKAGATVEPAGEVTQPFFSVKGKVITLNGGDVQVFEYVDAAVAYPKLAEATVVSKADPVKGKSIVLFVRLKEEFCPSPALKKELVNHMRDMVGPIAVPEEVYFVSKLPKTRSGKIMCRILKAVANKASIGDLTTLEDEASVEEVIKSYRELEQVEEAK